MTIWKKQLAVGPVIGVPTIALDGGANGAPGYADPSAFARKFSAISAPDRYRWHRP